MFCSGRVSTKEDVWPLWLLRMIGADKPGEMNGERGGAVLRSWRLAGSGIRVGFVCRGCNNGWMSELESRAKPVIEPLLNDAPYVLAADHQLTLAVWAVKSAMVFEALRLNQPWVFTHEERMQLRESSTLPQRTKVWIAKCINLPGPCCAASDLFTQAPASTDQERAYVTTMAFGPLAIQVLNFRLPYIVPDSVDITTDLRSGPWGSVAAQVWPGLQPFVSWPPSVGLDGEAGFSEFCDRWKPPGGGPRGDHGGVE
jgi:hypothetical protein